MSSLGQRIRLFVLRCALAKVTRNLAPSRIPRTGDAAKNVDCYSAEIRGLDGAYFDVQIDKVFKRGLRGRSWSDGNGYRKKVTLKNQDIRKIEFSATHFLGTATFNYSSPLRFLIKEYLGFPKISIAYDKVQQWWFNSRTPRRTNRIKLLNKLIGFRLEIDGTEYGYPMDNNGLGIFEVLTKIHGDRFYRHPSFVATKAEYELILESLVDSGDVSVVNHNFRATGKALSTIARYEQENRRHREQMQHNSWIKWLTLALVIVGCIQGYAVLSNG